MKPARSPLWDQVSCLAASASCLWCCLVSSIPLKGSMDFPTVTRHLFVVLCSAFYLAWVTSSPTSPKCLRSALRWVLGSGFQFPHLSLAIPLFSLPQRPGGFSGACWFLNAWRQINNSNTNSKATKASCASKARQWLACKMSSVSKWISLIVEVNRTGRKKDRRRQICRDSNPCRTQHSRILWGAIKLIYIFME